MKRAESASDEDVDDVSVTAVQLVNTGAQRRYVMLDVSAACARVFKSD